MLSLIVVYDKSDRLHVVQWTVTVTDLTTARRVVGQLVRRHRRDVAHVCTVTHYTISDMVGRKGLPTIVDAGRIDQDGSVMDVPPSDG